MFAPLPYPKAPAVLTSAGAFHLCKARERDDARPAVDLASEPPVIAQPELAHVAVYAVDVCLGQRFEVDRIAHFQRPQR